MKDKEFDAVRMMREIRDELSRRYNEDPSAEGKDLQEIRKRCGIKDGAYLDSYLRRTVYVFGMLGEIGRSSTGDNNLIMPTKEAIT
ncbi:MAG: hypothetical protein ACTSW7_04540 [Candidatus Thorarchaeota archaeon]